MSLPLILKGQEHSNQKKSDSIKKVIENYAKTDTNLALLYFQLAELNYLTDYNQAIEACNEAMIISNKLDYKKGIQDSYGWLAYLYDQKGNPVKALNYQIKALDILKDSNDKKEYATALNNVGNIYYKLGKVDLGIEYFLKSLKIEEELQNTSGLGTSYNNLGVLYRHQKDHEKAIKYFKKALKLYKETGDKKEEGTLYNNLGALYFTLENLDTAQYYFEKAIRIAIEVGNKIGEANSNSNLGQIFEKRGKISTALVYYTKSYEIRKELDEKEGIVSSLSNLASIHLTKNQLDKSQELLEEALPIAKTLGYPDKLASVSKLLSEVYYKKGQGLKATDMYKLHVKMRDSIFNEKTQKKTIQKELQYEYDKKAVEDSVAFSKESEIRDAQIAKQKAELKLKRDQQLLLGIGIVFLLIFALIVVNRYRHSIKQKKVIQQQQLITESQKNTLEIKNNEILDSINYALRIQNAILPSLESIKSAFKESFILFRPKDVVSGDFYWFEKHKGNYYIAVADCTGHGVPGAMISVICSTALSKALLEENITNPAEILNRTRQIITDHFKKSSDKIQDGMDITLCKINGLELEWSGANNPLWIIRENESSNINIPDSDFTTLIDETSNKILFELIPDKQPVGKYDNAEDFTCIKTTLQPKDTIYLMTDGYADQFGSSDETTKSTGGKKFKKAKLKKLLLKIQNKSLVDQKQTLSTEFDNWKGNLEQVDDTCLVGLKIQ